MGRIAIPSYSTFSVWIKSGSIQLMFQFHHPGGQLVGQGGVSAGVYSGQGVLRLVDLYLNPGPAKRLRLGPSLAQPLLAEGDVHVEALAAPLVPVLRGGPAIARQARLAADLGLRVGEAPVLAGGIRQADVRLLLRVPQHPVAVPVLLLP